MLELSKLLSLANRKPSLWSGEGSEKWVEYGGQVGMRWCWPAATGLEKT